MGFALLSAIPLQEGLAWGPVGHRIVGHIAEMNLQPGVLKTIQREFNIKHLANVANWADEMKKKKRPPDVLHYTNIAVDQRIYDQQRDCPRKRCVTEKLKVYQHILADGSASPASRKEAFKFLIHLMADVHQPMHMGYAKDRGGNEISVVFQGKPTNLHKVWDSKLIYLNGKTRGQFARQLNRSITPEDRKKWSGGGPEDWTNESRALVLDYGYKLRFSQGRTLSPEYIKQGQIIVEERLKRAGVRLAQLLNRLLKH